MWPSTLVGQTRLASIPAPPPSGPSLASSSSPTAAASPIPSSTAPSLARELSLKILVLGGASVGKTTIVNVYAEAPFTQRYVPTLGMDVVVVPAGTLARRRAFLRFFDVSHAEVHGTPGHLALVTEGAAAAIVVVDITSLESMDAADRWLHVLRERVPGLGRDVPVMLLAHKADLLGTSEAVVTGNDLDHFTQRAGLSGWRFTTAAHHFGSSIKTAIHTTVDLVFQASGSQGLEAAGPTNGSHRGAGGAGGSGSGAGYTGETGGVVGGGGLPRIQQLLMSTATYVHSPWMRISPPGNNSEGPPDASFALAECPPSRRTRSRGYGGGTGGGMEGEGGDEDGAGEGIAASDIAAEIRATSERLAACGDALPAPALWSLAGRVPPGSVTEPSAQRPSLAPSSSVSSPLSSSASASSLSSSSAIGPRLALSYSAVAIATHASSSSSSSPPSSSSSRKVDTITTEPRAWAEGDTALLRSTVSASRAIRGDSLLSHGGHGGGGEGGGRDQDAGNAGTRRKLSSSRRNMITTVFGHVEQELFALLRACSSNADNDDDDNTTGCNHSTRIALLPSVITEWLRLLAAHEEALVAQLEAPSVVDSSALRKDDAARWNSVSAMAATGPERSALEKPEACRLQLIQACVHWQTVLDTAHSIVAAPLQRRPP